jgi:hypothetical protein
MTEVAEMQTGAQQSAVSAQETQNQAQTGAQQTPAQPPQESFYSPDGTLKPGWQNSDLVPQDFRGRPVYNAVGNDVASLLRHIGHQDIAISKQGKGIFVPSPDATQTEKDFFYKALGRPDKPEGYAEAIKKAIPQGMEGHYDDPEMIGNYQTVAHKLGLNPQQAASIIAFDAQRLAKAEADIKADPVTYFEELLPLVEPIYKAKCEEELKKKWGDAYDARLHLANRAITENTKEGEERDLLLARVGNDPVVADFIATIMNKSFTSGMSVDTSLGTSPASMNVDQTIGELMRDPNYLDGRTSPARHKYLVDEVQRLMASKRK